MSVHLCVNVSKFIRKCQNFYSLLPVNLSVKVSIIMSVNVGLNISRFIFEYQ